MGMDCYGVKPNPPAGEYFRASIWSWPPIVSVLESTCSDILTDKDFTGIRCNDGYKIGKSRSVKIANRLAVYLEHSTSGKAISPDEAGPLAAVMVSLLEEISGRGLDVQPPTPKFCVEDEHLAEFAAFCRESGGFQVC